MLIPRCYRSSSATASATSSRYLLPVHDRPAKIEGGMVVGGPLGGTILPGRHGGMVVGGPLGGSILPGEEGGMIIGGPLGGTILPSDD